MLSNTELKEKLNKVHPEYFDLDRKGSLKWKTARIYTTILYPENIDDIENGCVSLGVPCSLSPLHNGDIKDSSTGQLKKEHYHLIVYYKGKTTPFSFYTALCSAFGDTAFSTIEIGRDIGALVRYSCHLDNDDKTKYNIEDIKDFNGFSSKDYLVKIEGDIMNYNDKIMDVIDDNGFLFFNDLARYLRSNDYVLYTVLVKEARIARFARNYIKSKEQQMIFDGDIQVSRYRETLPDGKIRYLTDKKIVNQ